MKQYKDTTEFKIKELNIAFRRAFSELGKVVITNWGLFIIWYIVYAAGILAIDYYFTH